MGMWLLLNVVCPLILPVFFVWGGFWIFRDSVGYKRLGQILRDGQAMFYCTSIILVAIGDIKKAPQEFDGSSWYVGFTFLAVISTVAFAIAVFTNGAGEGRRGDEDRFCKFSIIWVSVIIFVVGYFRYRTGLT